MTGIERIAKERQRQIFKEGWTHAHDDGHVNGEMATAAACYAAPDKVFFERVTNPEHLTPGHIRPGKVYYHDPFPWDEDWDRRGDFDRIRQLEIAGALVAAEIDRLLRLEMLK